MARKVALRGDTGLGRSGTDADPGLPARRITKNKSSRCGIMMTDVDVSNFLDFIRSET